ncbi:MAG: ATP-binding protein [Candidatus Woesearchaeota archaeon]
MDRRLSDLAKMFSKIPKEQESALERVAKLVSALSKEAQFAVKTNRAKVTLKDIAVGSCAVKMPFVESLTKHSDEVDDINAWNLQLKRAAEEELFDNVSDNAEKYLLEVIAPNIKGLDDVRKAASWLLFADDPVHLLLLGDPGTGKTQVLQAVSRIAPISSFGLGSGSSKAGLTVAASGNEVLKGLLPLADGGVCCVDELNLMKREDRAGLLSAMESGVVIYDKAGKHLELPAEVSVFASANPKGDRFVGNGVEVLKQQIPFDPALVSRFHIVFLVRRPDAKDFADIAKGIVSGVKKPDTVLAKEYVKRTQSISVAFPKDLEPVIVDAVERFRRDESKFLLDVTPRLVVGVVRLAKARARLHMRETVTQEDVKSVIKVVEKSLYVRER